MAQPTTTTSTAECVAIESYNNFMLKAQKEGIKSNSSEILNKIKTVKVSLEKFWKKRRDTRVKLQKNMQELQSYELEVSKQSEELTGLHSQYQTALMKEAQEYD